MFGASFEGVRVREIRNSRVFRNNSSSVTFNPNISLFDLLIEHDAKIAACSRVEDIDDIPVFTIPKFDN